MNPFAITGTAASFLFQHYEQDEAYRVVEDIYRVWVDFGKDAALAKNREILADHPYHVLIAVRMSLSMCDNPGDWKLMMHISLESKKEGM